MLKGKFIIRIKEIWHWLSIDNNAARVIAVCAVATLFVLSIPAAINSVRNIIRRENTYITSRPSIKIKSVYLKICPYQETSGTQSMALTFHIPIRNEGDTTAYDVEITRKDLSLVRGTWNLSNPSLQTMLTNAPFDLKPRDIVEDTIYIDESPANMQKISNGEISASLKYEIRFYANKKSKSEPFMYQYEAKYSRGEFYDISENLKWDIKP